MWFTCKTHPYEVWTPDKDSVMTSATKLFQKTESPPSRTKGQR